MSRPLRPSAPRTPRGVLLALLALLLGLVPLVLTTRASAAPVTFKASADSYVRSDTPDTNYGAKYVLATSALSATTPTTTSYVRFDVTGLGAAPASVVLRLYSYASSASGVQVSASSNGWTESGITFTNAPGVGAPVGTMSNLAVNAWSELDVTSAVTGNGTYTFAVTTTSTSTKQLSSREATATPPQLVVEPAATTTPTATATATATATTTPTATVTPTTTPTATTSTAPDTTTTSFVPRADASVRSDQPDLNAGGAYTLYAQAPSATGPEQRSYVKVAVSGLGGTVTSARLRLWSYSTSTDGVEVALAGSDWTETGLTWSNAPPPGARVGAAPLTLSTWAEVDVTSAVTGNGTYTFVVTTPRTSANKVGSREATGASPQLVVTTSSGSTATSSPTPTTTTTPTTTSTATTTPTTTSTPTATSTTDAPGDPTLVAAGDIACPQGKTPTSTSCQQQATSDLAVSLKPDALLPLGDNVYELGSLADYQAMYAPTWGRLDSVAHPVPGNHEYGYIGTAVQPTGGAGYFSYFGPSSHPLAPDCTSSCPSWYSYDVGAWHLVALDSQCAVVGGCNPGNPQYQWLLDDLKAHPNACTLAYWHIPLFSSSQDHQPDMSSIYKLLYDKGADVVLNGHAHFYERFAPQDATGAPDPARGIRELLVGTGGRSFFAVRDTPAANSETRIANTFGVLQMTLHPTGYDWRFVPTAGSTATDSGSASCH